MDKFNGNDRIILEQIISVYEGVLQSLVGAKIPTCFKSVVLVEDVLQTVWMEVDSCLSGFEFRTERQLGAWVKDIARSRLCDALRKARAHGRGDVRVVGQDRTSATDAIGACAADQLSPSGAVAAGEAGSELLRALQTLAPRDRQIIRLRYWDGLTPMETARALGLPLTTVNSATYRSKRAIAERMGGAGRYFDDP